MTQADLHEWLSYRDGKLFWKKSKSNVVKMGQRAGNGSSTSGYRTLRFNGTLYLEHRLIWMWHHGYMPTCLDHIDRDKHNNKIENLREVSSRENMLNRRLFSNNTSGVKNIAFRADRGVFTVSKRIHGKTCFYKEFKTLEHANEYLNTLT